MSTERDAMEKRLLELELHVGSQPYSVVLELTGLVRSASLKLAAADRLAEAYADHVCACEQPHCGAQPVGVFRCERCGKCCAESLRSALLEYSRTTV